MIVNTNKNYMNVKHWTLSYVVSRLGQIFWLKLNPYTPWMTPKAVELLAQLIKPNDIGIEFGSGRSTQWFAKRCSFLTSIENNKEWFDKVSDDLKNMTNVTYRYATVDKVDPEHSDYLQILAGINESTLDFIINDGKLRDWVAVLSLPKLKAGGFIVLDNAERYLPNEFKLPESMGLVEIVNPQWRSFANEVSEWRKIWTVDGVSSTLLLIKP